MAVTLLRAALWLAALATEVECKDGSIEGDTVEGGAIEGSTVEGGALVGSAGYGGGACKHGAIEGDTVEGGAVVGGVLRCWGRRYQRQHC